MTYRHFKYEGWLYGLAFLLALGLRLMRLGAMPLNDAEAELALHKPSPKSSGLGGGQGGGQTPQEQEMAKREIESTDKAIDQLVYELYGLSPEEIRIVEGKV